MAARTVLFSTIATAVFMAAPVLGECRDDANRCFTSCNIYKNASSEQYICRRGCYDMLDRCVAAPKPVAQVDSSNPNAIPLDVPIPSANFGVERRSDQCTNDAGRCFTSCSIYKNASSEQYNCRRGCYDMWSRCSAVPSPSPPPQQQQQQTTSRRQSRRAARQQATVTVHGANNNKKERRTIPKRRSDSDRENDCTAKSDQCFDNCSTNYNIGSSEQYICRRGCFDMWASCISV